MMKQRRAAQSKDDALHVEPTRSIAKGKKLIKARFLLGNALFLVFLMALVLLSSRFWWYDLIAKKNRNVHAVFSLCRETDDGVLIGTAAPVETQLLYPCVYLRPSLYFLDPSWPGYQYKELIHDISSTIRLSMWEKQVSDLSPDVGASHPNNFLVQQGITSISTVMMPKVASRTIDSLFLERLSVQQKPIPAARSTVVTRAKKKGPKVGTANPAFWREVARRQTKTQQQQRRPSDIVFALLRDPVARFLSSLAQTLSVPMLKKWENRLEVQNKPLRAQVWEPCLNSTSTSTYSMLVRCLIDSMKEKEVGYFDVHMAPQAVFLAGALDGNNVKVAMFSMDRLDAVLDAFGATKQQKNKRETKKFSPEVLNRFGTELLDPAKAREAVSDDMLRDICELYAVDVDLMRYLGFAVNDCIE
jgi:hypothetical protein